MRPLVVITPARAYMDVLVTFSGVFCVIRPNTQLNKRKLTDKELAFAYRYVHQEGWVEYANGGWEPDPELSAFMNEMIGVST
jgi:hypothetical protein